MKMARIILVTLLFFNLIIVPAMAFPFGFKLKEKGNKDEADNNNNNEDYDNNNNNNENENENENNNNNNEYEDNNNNNKKNNKNENNNDNNNNYDYNNNNNNNNYDYNNNNNNNYDNNNNNNNNINNININPNVNPNLKQGFYSGSCPNAEKIVADALAEIVKVNPNAVASLLRLQFHDCFVVGCDASVLLDFSPTGENVEKSSFFNGQLLKGADIIDDIKAKLEEQCPGIVSCTDTLSFAVNEGMTIYGLPRRVPLGGRRDSLSSLATIVEDNNLPMPGWSMEKMVELFERKGFTIEEMVILLGAHSVGSVHCDIFMERVFNFENTRKPDPTLSAQVVNEFQEICKGAGTPQFRNPPVNFDETPTVLDTLFFKNMVNKNKTTMLTDSHLINDPRTIPVVQQMANQEGLWQQKFPIVMDKMSSLNVLTGNNGEVRKTCRSTN